MKAAVYYGKENVVIEERHEPKPGKKEVKIKVKWCGICGSDLHEYFEGPIAIPTKPHPLTGKCIPLIIGHEFSGEIVEVGEGVKGWKIGDRVTCDASIVDWECYWCKRFQTNYCEKLAVTGVQSDGAFAEYVVVNDYQLRRLPPNVSYEEGAMIEPLACAVQAMRRVEMQPGDTVFIAGSGPLGLCCLKVALAAGAGEVYVSQRSKERREIAKLDATKVFDPTVDDIKKEILQLTNGVGVDVAFEAVGSESALRTCLDVVKKRGKICTLGMFRDPIPINPFIDITATGKSIVGSIIYDPTDFDRSLKLISTGKVKLQPLLTGKIKLDDIVEKGFMELRHKRSHIKILVSPE